MSEVNHLFFLLGFFNDTSIDNQIVLRSGSQIFYNYYYMRYTKIDIQPGYLRHSLRYQLSPYSFQYI